jgi:arsenate reductase
VVSSDPIKGRPVKSTAKDPVKDSSKQSIRGGRPPMRGSATPRTPSVPAASPAARANPPVQPVRAKKRVLFVCIGNSCRSQMAEAFARAYGSDILEVWSAGLAPATIVAPLTKLMLNERNIPAADLFPKSLGDLRGEAFDVVVNLSGTALPPFPQTPAPRVIVWPVTDPIGQKESVYRDVADRIESLVMGLILELRSA